MDYDKSRRVGAAVLRAPLFIDYLMLAGIQSALAHARLSYVGLAVLLYAVSVPLSALRWRAVLGGLNQRLPLDRLILANLAASFVNNVTPAARVSGEACRIVALVRMRLGTVVSTASVAYERLSEAPAILLLAMITLFVIGRGEAATRMWAAPGFAVWSSRRELLAVLVALTIGAAALWWVGAFARGARGLRAARVRLFETVRIAPSALVASAIFSTVLWSLDVIRLRTAAAAIEVPIGLPQAAALSAITVVAGWVPTIGGLGAVEGGLIAGLIGFGVAPADAAAVTTIERGISYGLATVMGAGALSLLGGRALWEAARARTRAEGTAP